MAANNQIILTYFPYLILLLLLLLLSLCNHASSSCFKSIISFGDSLTDTGNLLHRTPSEPELFFKLPPYGETFFNRPTGRFSDGRLIIDFIAEYLGLPLVPPFFDGNNSSHRSSVNFAVAGATALPESVFEREGIEIHHTNASLADQLSWFNKLFLPRFYNESSDRKKYLESSLVIVGEMGGNDYNHPLLQGKTLEIVKAFVPQVVNVISSTVKEVIKAGAVTVMVPGNLPIGCLATYLTHFKTSNKSYYDPKTGCLIWLNKFAQYHNHMLSSEIRRIQTQNPHTNIIYADYYNAAMLFYRSPQEYGFPRGALAACCPTCRPYDRVDPEPWQLEPDLRKVCVDPSEFVSWDGLHLTEAAYKIIATALVRGSSHRLHSICDVSSNDSRLPL